MYRARAMHRIGSANPGHRDSFLLLIHIKSHDRDSVYSSKHSQMRVMMFNRILVCFDGSDHAAAALRIAADLANRYRATMVIVHVPEIRNDAIAVGSEVIFVPTDEAEVRARAAEVLEQGAAIATEAGHAAASTKVLRGSAAEAILAYAKDDGIDLIVSGRRGMGTLRGLLVGSVSQKLTSHAACPVLTVQ
ncbi:universal stress protein [Loktanella sp. M215]|nr:universal stress protein [Loktanella sp. M215]